MKSASKPVSTQSFNYPFLDRSFKKIEGSPIKGLVKAAVRAERA
jgi:hypothetical protein